MTRARQQAPPGLDLIEEATHLLRTAPAMTLAIYFVGAIPFVLGLLYFWTDMSRSPFANQHLAGAAFGIAILFGWMKFWQTIFARRLRAQIAGAPAPQWTFRQCRRIFMTQAIVQPVALFVLPGPLTVLLPATLLPLTLCSLSGFVWIYAFCQNVTALDDGDSERNRHLFTRAWKQACLWPMQNFRLLAILGGFGLCVFVNLSVVISNLPELARMLFGVESVFSRSGAGLLNTTFFAAIIGLTYLCIDPLVKATYVLRCFYGEARRTGEDLKAELKPHALPASQLAAVLAILLLLAGGSSAMAADTSTPAVTPGSPPAVSSPDLDHAIDETIHQRKYTWRLPRETVPDAPAEEGVIAKFLRRVAQWIGKCLNWIGDLLRKLFGGHGSSRVSGGGGDWITPLYLLLYVVIAVVAVALVMLLIRVWRGRRQTPAAVTAAAIASAPDLTDENVGADQLPEDGWTKLARELLERGEFRLAMRAFYLATLANLAQRNLISIARFKSNRDYVLELHRRGHSLPNLLSTFGENLSVFEQSWYGMHEVNRDRVDHFAENVERIRSAG